MSTMWCYVKNGTQIGPVPEEQLAQLATTGQLSPDTLVWKEGLPNWVNASTVRAFFTNPPVPAAPPLPPPVIGPSLIASQRSALEKCYLPFSIALVVIFALGSLTLGVTYLYGLFLPAIGFSICNFIAGKDNRLGTSPWDLIILILAGVSLIPLLGWFTQMTALAFSIVAIVKVAKRRQA